MIKISLLGSTGSIGRQVLDVVRRNPNKFEIVGLSANRNARIFLSQILEFKPKYCSLSSTESALEIVNEIPKDIDFFMGENALDIVSKRTECDILFVAVMGFCGLKAVLNGIEIGKTIALANKETLVSGGEIVMKKAREKGVDIIPVDSEHSALWQALNYNKNAPFKKLIITASGGAFRNFTQAQLEEITPKDALKHPTWNMGSKITIDSGTLMNKGLEVIEAKWLYNTSLDKIETIIHPQSIIHSMVEFIDSSIIAELSYPSMEIPIQIALTYPEKLPTSVPSLDFKTLHKLEFYELEENKFPCYHLALESSRMGKNMPTVMNATNEEAVASFLNGRIKFTDIAVYINKVMDKIKIENVLTFEDIKENDLRARAYYRELL